MLKKYFFTFPFVCNPFFPKSCLFCMGRSPGLAHFFRLPVLTISVGTVALYKLEKNVKSNTVAGTATGSHGNSLFTFMIKCHEDTNTRANIVFLPIPNKFTINSQCKAAWKG